VLGGIVAAMLYEFVFAANASCRKAKGFLLSSSYESSEYEGPLTVAAPNNEAAMRMVASSTHELDLNLEHKDSLLKVNDDIQV
jgi:hypothetical protein